MMWRSNISAASGDESRDPLSAKLPGLRELMVSDTRSEDFGLMSIGTNLTHLTLYSRTFSDADLDRLLPLQKLEELVFYGARNLTDASLPTLAKFPHLRELGLGGSAVDDVDGLSALPALEKLISVHHIPPRDQSRLLRARPGLVFE